VFFMIRSLTAAALSVLAASLVASAQSPGSAARTKPAVMLKGDPVRGATVYENSCGGCHSLDANRIGPAHRGVVGRKAGAAADFNYSPALKASRVTWTAEKLDIWLSGPRKLVPSARMAFQLSDAQRRADVIAYLTEEGKKSPPT
jgi:cytochrome c